MGAWGGPDPKFGLLKNDKSFAGKYRRRNLDEVEVVVPLFSSFAVRIDLSVHQLRE